MTEKVELEQLQDSPDGLAHHFAASDLRRLSDVPVEMTVEIGRAKMTVGETLELRHGSIVSLDRMAGEPVDLLVNGTPIARGEVVVIDEQFGLRITDVVGQSAAGDAESETPEVGTPGPTSDAGDIPA